MCAGMSMWVVHIVQVLFVSNTADVQGMSVTRGMK